MLEQMCYVWKIFFKIYTVVVLSLLKCPRTSSQVELSLVKCPRTSSHVELLYSCGIAYLRHFEGRNKVVFLQNVSCIMCVLQNAKKHRCLCVRMINIFTLFCVD